MPRQKQYDEQEVIDKAMHLFWRKGYENTSARMLESEMNINLFSIYASFKNKEGVLLESLKAYKKLLRNRLMGPLKNGEGLFSIKDYFYNFLRFTKEKDSYKGCLLINTSQELSTNMNKAVAQEITQFSEEIMNTFTSILAKNTSKTAAQVTKEADYLFVALVGMITSARVMQEEQIRNYIEMTFDQL